MSPREQESALAAHPDVPSEQAVIDHAYESLRFMRERATYLKSLEKLTSDLGEDRSPATAWVGVAPHSVRAVPLDYLHRVIAHANQANLKVHMHVAEQPAEVSACVEEYGRTPVALLQTEGLLSESFTAVHAIHVTPKAILSFARTGAMVCACPTTERNLGDGVVPADDASGNR